MLCSLPNCTPLRVLSEQKLFKVKSCPGKSFFFVGAVERNLRYTNNLHRHGKERLVFLSSSLCSFFFSSLQSTWGHVCLCVYLSVCLCVSLRLPVCCFFFCLELSIYLSIFLHVSPICLSLQLSLCLLVHLSYCHPFPLYFSQTACLCFCLTISLAATLSGYLPACLCTRSSVYVRQSVLFV